MTADPVRDWALIADTDLDTLSARRKQKDRREAFFLFVLEDQAQHREKVGDHVAVHEFVAGPPFGEL